MGFIMTPSTKDKPEALKCCPFCGGDAEVYSATVRRPDDGIYQGHWVADCLTCDASIEFCDSDVDAATKWNTRTQTPPVSIASEGEQ